MSTRRKPPQGAISHLDELDASLANEKKSLNEGTEGIGNEEDAGSDSRHHEFDGEDQDDNSKEQRKRKNRQVGNSDSRGSKSGDEDRNKRAKKSDTEILTDDPEALISIISDRDKEINLLKEANKELEEELDYLKVCISHGLPIPPAKLKLDPSKEAQVSNAGQSSSSIYDPMATSNAFAVANFPNSNFGGGITHHIGSLAKSEDDKTRPTLEASYVLTTTGVTPEDVKGAKSHLRHLLLHRFSPEERERLMKEQKGWREFAKRSSNSASQSRIYRIFRDPSNRAYQYRSKVYQAFCAAIGKTPTDELTEESHAKDTSYSAVETVAAAAAEAASLSNENEVMIA